MSTLSDRLKSVRKGMTQSVIAKKLGIPQQTWNNYETGKSNPPIGLLDKICIDFSVSAEWLLFGRGPMRAGESPAVADSRTVELEGQVAELQKRLVALEQENKRLECEARNAQKEAVAAYRQAMDMVRDLVLQKGLPTIDAPASATTAPSISLTSDE